MISIIVPVYQAEKTLQASIDSILSQTYEDIEIILINDGSTDNSRAICDKYSENSKKVQVQHISNSGVSYARNLGLKLAKGQYIMFVDSDDTIESNMCEIMMTELTNFKADLVICGHKTIKNGKCICSNGINHVYSSKKDLLSDFDDLYTALYFNPPWNKLFIKEKIRDYFDTRFELGEDCIFNLSYLINTERVAFIKNDLYNYNYLSNGLTTKYRFSSIEAEFRKYELLYQYLYDSSNPETINTYRKIFESGFNNIYRLLAMNHFGDISHILNEMRKIYTMFWTNKKMVDNLELSLIDKLILNKYLLAATIVAEVYAIPYIAAKTIRKIIKR